MSVKPFLARVMAAWLAIAGSVHAQQPLPFSHKTHVRAALLNCSDCHPSPARFGDRMALPAASRCMKCHVTIAKEKPVIRKLAEFAKSGRPIPWVRVIELPDFVFFDHRFHLKSGVACESCHGAVGEMDVVADVLAATKMTSCQACHARAGANNRCTACHDNR